MNIAATVILSLTPLLQTAGGNPQDDFSPMLFFMFVVGVVLCLIAIGIGLAIGIFLLAAAGLLASAGIVTSSVIVGLVTGKVSAGWRTFLILCSVCTLTVLGAAAGWLIEKSASVHLVPSWAVVAGAGAGALVGILGALCFDWLLRLIARRAAALRHAPWVTRLSKRFFPRINNPSTKI